MLPAQWLGRRQVAEALQVALPETGLPEAVASRGRGSERWHGADGERTREIRVGGRQMGARDATQDPTVASSGKGG